MSERPLIGVSSYARGGKRESFSLPTAYVEAVRDAGGIPVILPPGEAEPSRLLEHVDGLVLSGGGDVSPARYSGRHHETVYGVCDERDHFEMELAAAALERPETPILAICRGMQVLNVVLGGTLHVHIAELGDRMLAHRDPAFAPTRHPASLKPDSRLAAIFGATEVEVCSFHHQAIHELGARLRPVGWAADGVVEAVEHETHPFCIGVQWHPEMQRDDPVQRRLFRAFVERSAGRAWDAGAEAPRVGGSRR
jgi:putative glutamine amidotransferase